MRDPYVDPATGVLYNRLGITDAVVLARAEGLLAFHAETALYASGAIFARCDLAALQSVHRHLFAEIYDWAGELRTVDIAKATARSRSRAICVRPRRTSSAGCRARTCVGSGHDRSFGRRPACSET